MTDLWTQKVTIINDTVDLNGKRCFKKSTITKCFIYENRADKSTDTISKNVKTFTISKNVKTFTVVTKDTTGYVSPEKYITLSETEKESAYTIALGDFVVFGEVIKLPEDAVEFLQMQKAYKDMGMKAMKIDVNVFGTDCDNIVITNAGG